MMHNGAPNIPYDTPWPEMDRFLARGGRARMLSVARRWIFSDLADDVVQEALIAAYRSRQNYKPGNFDAWIITITKRVAMALARKPSWQILSGDAVDEYGRDVLEEIAAAEEVAPSEENPQENLARVAGMLKAVVPGSDGALFCEVFILRDGSEEARLEVMQEFNLSSEALRQRLHRARERFTRAVGLCDEATRQRFETSSASLEDWEALVRASQSQMPAEQGMKLALSSMSAFVRAHRSRKDRQAAPSTQTAPPLSSAFPHQENFPL